MAKRNQSTARNPFSTWGEPQVVFTPWDGVLAGTVWQTSHRFELVNWQSFLSDTEPPMVYFAGAVDVMAEETELPLLSVLVGVAGDIFRALRSFQAAPTPAEGFKQLHEMRNVAKKLALLSRGGSATPEQPAAEASPERRSRGLHPFLHDLLQEVDAPNPQKGQDEQSWQKALSRCSSRNRRLLLFFDLLDGVVERLTISDKQVAENVQLDPRKRNKGAPRDTARDWLLIRLMWIWRDVIGKELTFHLPTIKNRVAVDPSPPDGSFIAFVCDVMREIEPVKPHEYSALAKKLQDLYGLLPPESLFAR